MMFHSVVTPCHQHNMESTKNAQTQAVAKRRSKKMKS